MARGGAAEFPVARPIARRSVLGPFMLNTERTPITGKRVQLMATCLCDAFYDDVAAATVQVLEHLGVEVAFPEGQTCCGQPAFNGGDWVASRKVVRHTVKTFAGDEPVVVPSGSCAAMLYHGAVLEFEKEPDLPEVTALGRRTWELTDFIVNGLGITQWPGKFEAKIALHRACHTRGSKTLDAALTLLRSIAGATVVEFGEPEQCCGFGGTFSVSFPNISAAMGTLKLEHLHAAQPDVVVSPDMSCMMHITGLAAKAGNPIKGMHLAQVLRDALKNGGKL
jgi:L-lactate dehydrogenase complex protein LldE